MTSGSTRVDPALPVGTRMHVPVCFTLFCSVAATEGRGVYQVEWGAVCNAWVFYTGRFETGSGYCME